MGNESKCTLLKNCLTCQTYDRFDGDIRKYYTDCIKEIEETRVYQRNVTIVSYAFNLIVVLMFIYYTFLMIYRKNVFSVLKNILMYRRGL